MKRLFYASTNPPDKMFQAPFSWQRFPNACRRVTTAAVRSTDFHDLDRLFSALIRIVRREMTFNEASGSHHISLNLIREVFRKIVCAMSDEITRLNNHNKMDIELRGDEMDERSFHFDLVSEKDLISATNENGEEYAIAIECPSIVRQKMLRIEASLNQVEHDHTYCQPFRLNNVDEVLPSPSEILPLFSLNSKVIKKEDEDDPATEQQNHVSPRNFNVDDFEYFVEEDKRLEMKEDEDQMIESFEDRPTSSHPFTDRNGEMNLCGTSKKFNVPQPILREKVQKIGQTLGRVSQRNDQQDRIIRDCISSITEAHNPVARRVKQLNAAVYAVYMGEMNRSAASIKFSVAQRTINKYADTAHFLLGDPLLPKGDPVDTKRIQTIRDSISAITGTHGQRVEQLNEAVYAVCMGEMTLYAASIEFSVARQILTKCAIKARALLGDDLPPLYGDPLDPHDTKRIQTIRDVINTITMRSQGERREQLKTALYAICVGELTEFEALNMFQLPYSTIWTNLQKVRVELGSILPPQAKSSNLESKEEKIDYDKAEIQEDETVTIDGITVPKSVNDINRLLSIGRLDYSKAKPFCGTRNELRDKLILILQVLNIRNNFLNIVDGIMHVYVDGRTCIEAYRIFNLSKTTFYSYLRAFKIFIDFDLSPCCTIEYDRLKVRPRKIRPDERGMEPPQPLPIPPERNESNWKILKEEIKEEPIEPPF